MHGISTPMLPFAEVATRAVGDINAERTTEPGLIIWTYMGKTWFADLSSEEMVYEAPESPTAKQIQEQMESARNLRPSDLDGFTVLSLVKVGGVRLMGPMWLVPSGATDGLRDTLRALPGAAVASIPVDSAEAMGEVLSLLAGHIQAECDAMLAGLDALKPETLRRRASAMRGYAEDVANVASMMGIDMAALGEMVLSSESTIRNRLGGKHYAPPLDFSGGAVAQRAPQWTAPAMPVAPRSYTVVQESHPDIDGVYRKPGDPPPAVPRLGTCAEVDEVPR